MNPVIATFFIGVVFSFPVLVVFLRRQTGSKSARRRLTMIQDSVRLKTGVAFADALELAEQQGFSARLGSFMERYRFSKRLKLLLIHADSSMDVGSFVLASAGAGFGCFLSVFLATRTLAWAAAATAAGAAAPYCVLRIKRRRRVKHFNAALPDAIDLMARSLLAGHSMGSSIEMVADQSPEPLSLEFAQVYQQQRLGLQFRDALLQMGARVPSTDLQFLITAILVQKETGGDLTEILTRTSHVIRERIRIEGEVRTHTAQGRLTGWILSLLPVVLLVLINLVSPGYSSILFHDSLGQLLLGSGAIFILIGGIIIRNIVDIQV